MKDIQFENLLDDQENHWHSYYQIQSNWNLEEKKKSISTIFQRDYKNLKIKDGIQQTPTRTFAQFFLLIGRIH